MFLFCYSLRHLSFSKGYWSFSYHKTFFLNLSFLLSLCYFPYFCLTQKLNFIFGDKDCFWSLKLSVWLTFYVDVGNRAVSCSSVLFSHPTVDEASRLILLGGGLQGEWCQEQDCSSSVFLMGGSPLFHEEVPGPSIIQIPRVLPHQQGLRVLAEWSDWKHHWGPRHFTACLGKGLWPIPQVANSSSLQGH